MQCTYRLSVIVLLPEIQRLGMTHHSHTCQRLYTPISL